MKVHFFLLILLIALSACKIDQSSKFDSADLIVGSNTFGRIDRYFAEDTQFNFPLNIIGTLDIPQDGRYCTASLIGKKHIITASHCITNEITNKLLKGKYSFRLKVTRNNNYSEKFKITKFYYREVGFLQNIFGAKNHWAILELDRETELALDTFKISYPGHDNYDESHHTNFDVKLAGYSMSLNQKSDGLTYTKGTCDIKEHLSDHHIGYHNCDSGPGDSGAPIYKCVDDPNNSERPICYLSAIHVGANNPSPGKSIWHKAETQYDEKFANIATLQKNFYWYAYQIPKFGEVNIQKQILNNEIIVKDNY